MRLSCTITEIWRLKCWTDAQTDGRSEGRTDAQVIWQTKAVAATATDIWCDVWKDSFSKF